MKKIGILLVVGVIVLFSAFAMASGSTESGTGDQGSGNAAGSSDSNSSLGDYSLVIDSCRLAKDYEGDDVVIVKYIFTNEKDDDAAAFYLAFEDTVYQDGVGLNEAYVLADSAKYNADNQTKEIKKGASIEVEVAYELNDKKTKIDVEVKELFSFSDKTLTKSFEIA